MVAKLIGVVILLCGFVALGLALIASNIPIENALASVTGTLVQATESSVTTQRQGRTSLAVFNYLVIRPDDAFLPNVRVSLDKDFADPVHIDNVIKKHQISQQQWVQLVSGEERPNRRGVKLIAKYGRQGDALGAGHLWVLVVAGQVFISYEQTRRDAQTEIADSLLGGLMIPVGAIWLVLSFAGPRAKLKALFSSDSAASGTRDQDAT